MSAGPSRQPGLLVVWTGAAPTLRAFALPREGLILGRELLGTTSDDRISRQHAKVFIRDSTGTESGVTRFGVTDLASRNGTFVSGALLVDRDISVTAPAVIRTGRTVALVLEDVTPFLGAEVALRGETVVGPSSTPAWRAVEAAAASGNNLLLLGEEGVGKGRLAEHYAASRGQREALFNPMVHALALERVVGDAATLLLEEPGKLTAAHQESLARLCEQREGLRVVTTASQKLEALGIAGPLAARLGAHVVEVPPLRARPEELAYVVAQAVGSAAPSLAIHSSLIEVSLLRPWPGNLRELASAVVRAAHEVSAAGKNNLRGEDLDTEAGYLMSGAPTINASVQPTMLGARRRRRSVSKIDEN